MTGEQFFNEIDGAETPLDAVELAGRLSLRGVVAYPINLARNVGKIVMNGDLGEAIREGANHL